jgi:hypothetical protein
MRRGSREFAPRNDVSVLLKCDVVLADVCVGRTRLAWYSWTVVGIGYTSNNSIERVAEPPAVRGFLLSDFEAVNNGK